MNISSSTLSSSMMQQMQQTQRKDQPNTVELSNQIIETSDLDSDSLLSIEEMNI
jgi:hypothetical protein